MTYGTSYFKSRAAAITYYRSYNHLDTRAAVGEVVDLKLADGLIHIGKPPLKPGEVCFLIDNGTRYAIQERS